MSPRERMLREDDDQVVVLPTDEERQAAHAAAAEARAQAALDEASYPGEPDEPVEQPEVFQVQELESQLTRLENIQSAEVPTVQKIVEADDALQGIAVVLAMGFSGDVQMVVLAALQRYRQIHGYTG